MDMKNHDTQVKEEFIARHKLGWEKTGAELKAYRTQLDLSRIEVATNLNVSSARIRNLELGNPVNDARLLTAAYQNYIILRTYEKALKYNALLLMSS